MGERGRRSGQLRTTPDKRWGNGGETVASSGQTPDKRRGNPCGQTHVRRMSVMGSLNCHSCAAHVSGSPSKGQRRITGAFCPDVRRSSCRRAPVPRNRLNCIYGGRQARILPADCNCNPFATGHDPLPFDNSCRDPVRLCLCFRLGRLSAGPGRLPIWALFAVRRMGLTRLRLSILIRRSLLL